MYRLIITRCRFVRSLEKRGLPATTIYRQTLKSHALSLMVLCGIGICVVSGGFAVAQPESSQADSSPSALIAHGSFEKQAKDGTPVGWSCQTDVDDRRALVVKTAHSGSSAIKVTAQGHAVSWSSDRIDVQPGRTYRLGFQMNADGQGHWSYALKDFEVVVSVQSAEGASKPLLSNEIRVLRTNGWSQAWLYVPVPQGCTSLQVAFHSKWPAVGTPQGTASRLARFWYGTGAGKPGRLLIDDVTLEPVDDKLLLAERSKDVGSRKLQKGLLSIQTKDGRTGASVPARIRVVNAEGRSIAPKDSYRFRAVRWKQRPGERKWERVIGDVRGFVGRREGPVQFLVTPGTYTVRAVRGFTVQPLEQEVVVKSGEVARVELQFGLRRPEWLAQWKAQGWRGGDHHVHLFFHSRTRYPLMTIPSVCRVARAEGLEYICFQAELAWMKRHIKTNPDFKYGEFICEVAHEVTTDFWGHVNYVNAVSIPDLPMPPALWPSNLQIRNMIDKNGSVLVYTHPFGRMNKTTYESRLAEPKVGLIARGLPIDALMGQRCMVDILSGSTSDMAFKMQILERLWNLGFKFGVGGSSDAYVDQAGRIPGGFRTFALCQSNDFKAIGRAYREGRTFATNGPLLRLSVDGHRVGDTVRLQKPRSVKVDIRAHSWWGLSSVELVHDGKVVAKIPAGTKTGGIQSELEVKIDRSGWLYARVWGPSSPELRNVRDNKQERQFGMTSPVWFDVHNRPQVIRTEDVEFFERWLKAVAKALPGYRERLLPSGQFGTVEQLRNDEENAASMVYTALRKLRALSNRAQRKTTP